MRNENAIAALHDCGRLRDQDRLWLLVMRVVHRIEPFEPPPRLAIGAYSPMRIAHLHRENIRDRPSRQTRPLALLASRCAAPATPNRSRVRPFAPDACAFAQPRRGFSIAGSPRSVPMLPAASPPRHPGRATRQTSAAASCWVSLDELTKRAQRHRESSPRRSHRSRQIHQCPAFGRSDIEHDSPSLHPSLIIHPFRRTSCKESRPKAGLVGDRDPQYIPASRLLLPQGRPRCSRRLDGLTRTRP